MTNALTGSVDSTLKKLAEATGDQTVDREAVRRLAQEFESLLMTQMIREMRRSMLDDEEMEGLGASTFNDTSDVEFARALSAAGGVGLANAMLEVFERQIAQPPAASTRQEYHPAAVAAHSIPKGSPAGHDERIDARPSIVPPAVNSTFGWRTDPLTGRPRFHNGIDVAAAYGANVEAAGTGRVAFAGVQGGYGETIVIDHGGGRQTRYAHLSERLVQAGDSVRAGQIVGRAGSSGRSTGPHLHFELLVNGTPVDPRSALTGGGLGGPKALAQGVD
ncbi:MAG TPA: peptidoglycan DD-metalloendopeptidase family protein [Vicinamibacterales bacterium]|nr:peptidoglycan DD-metalloendopeptidase family protein [Vicinamibacterales bacterium]